MTMSAQGLAWSSGQWLRGAFGPETLIAAAGTFCSLGLIAGNAIGMPAHHLRVVVLGTGPGSRAAAANTDPDFRFPQMAAPHVAGLGPTDTLPLTRWTK